MEKGSDLIPSPHNTMCKLFVIGQELVFSMVTVHKSSFLDLKNVEKADSSNETSHILFCNEL